ncbi:MAG: peptidylprolyl isomerase [Chromatiales bacterium]|nr:peptidylprolyl isomerase [Chromatiales bacterium]
MFHRVIGQVRDPGRRLPARHGARSRPAAAIAERGRATACATSAAPSPWRAPSDPHSATSQFYINVADNDFLNYTTEPRPAGAIAVFGKVVDGMDRGRSRSQGVADRQPGRPSGTSRCSRRADRDRSRSSSRTDVEPPIQPLSDAVHLRPAPVERRDPAIAAAVPATSCAGEARPALMRCTSSATCSSTWLGDDDAATRRPVPLIDGPARTDRCGRARAS